MERYGVEYLSQNEHFRKKIEQTNLEKYGFKKPSQNEVIKNKTKQTNLERYGVECYSKTKKYKQQVVKTNLERYGVEYIVQLKNTTSKIELDLLDWIKTLNVDVEGSKWFSNKIKWYELDIYLPEYNIGIEMDGCYYHTPTKKGKGYHLNKTNWFKENYNIDVIHIVDLEWLDYENRKEIENIIKYKLGLEKLKENKYIKNNVYDRRFFNEIEGKLIESKIIKFGKHKYENCGYVKKEM